MEALASPGSRSQAAVRKSMSRGSRQRSSSYGKYSDQLTPEFDPTTYSAGQSLASILNNPHGDSSWSSWFFAADSTIETSSSPLPVKTLPEVSKAEFANYLDSVTEAYNRFVDVQEHFSLEEGEAGEQPSTSSSGGESEALASCLREIPSLYFEEDFSLEKGSTFQAACPFSTIPQNMMLQEKLSHYLDVVEVHLVKEISARSESFYEAQRQLEDLNGKMIDAVKQTRELKAAVHLLESDLVEMADQIHTQSVRRENLLTLHDKLKLMTYVNQALSALRILVGAADCAGALDVIDELQQLLEGDELAGMHCFRHLADQLASSTEAVNSMLAVDFIRVSIHDSRDLESSAITSIRDGPDFILAEAKVEEKEADNIREQLVPLVIGLLRTSKLPAVLRDYKEALTTDIKTAIKTVVAELLPILLTRPSDGDVTASDRQTELDVGMLSLASKLRSLSPDSFLQLLVSVYKTVHTRLVRAAAIRHIIEDIISGLQGSHAAEAVAAAFASGAAAVAAAEAAQEERQGSIPVLAQTVTDSDPLMYRNKGTQISNISRQFRADVLRENTEALWAACDAAHGRWSKLLGVRAPVHLKLRVHEFVSIYNVTQEFISATEKVGGRLGYNIRGTLHSQAKSFVDAQHASRISKITAVLDQETWVAVDVPDEFQEIVERLIPAKVDSEVVQSNGDLRPEEANGSKDHPLERKEAVSDFASENSKPKKPRRTIRIHGTAYHMVNSGLILLKIVSEYVEITSVLPAVVTEVIHRLGEILKIFNSRSCQLVLGAGVLQVLGLKSITAKHLALASQTITFFQVLIPEVKDFLSVQIPEARKALLMSELDRVAQDYKVHRDEIHSKLVQIMKERMLGHLKMLPRLVEEWNKGDDSNLEPSQFAATLTREVGVLHKVLSPLLLEEDLRSIFTRVVAIFHSQLPDTFSTLDVSTPQANRRLYTDVSHILACIRSLPVQPFEDDNRKPRELENFIIQRFGSEVQPAAAAAAS